jgi:thioredoxin 2
MAGRATIITCPNCGKKNRVPPSAAGIPRCGNCHEPLPWDVEADRDSFELEIAAEVPVVVDFWAPWCAPCRMVTPVLEKLSRDLAGKLKVVKLNVDSATDVAARYQAQSIPLLVLIKDGAEVDRLVGAVPEPSIRSWLEPHLSGVASGERA